MRPAGMDLLQFPSVMCSPPREGLSEHRANGEAQSIEGDSSFQSSGHQGWPHVHMPIPSLPNYGDLQKIFEFTVQCKKNLFQSSPVCIIEPKDGSQKGFAPDTVTAVWKTYKNINVWDLPKQNKARTVKLRLAEMCWPMTFLRLIVLPSSEEDGVTVLLKCGVRQFWSETQSA